MFDVSFSNLILVIIIQYCIIYSYFSVREIFVLSSSNFPFINHKYMKILNNT